MTEIVKKIKLNLLQNYYKELSQVIFNLSNHIDFLYEYFLMDYSVKQTILNKLNELNRNINTNYNSFIVEDLELNTKLDKWINEFKNVLNLTDENQITEMMYFSKFIELESLPLSKVRIDLTNIVSACGYKNLEGLLSFFVGKNYKSLLDKNIIKYISELNNIFIPTSFDIFNVERDELYYWRYPTNFEENDPIQQVRELWIKYYNKYIKINPYLNNDT